MGACKKLTIAVVVLLVALLVPPLVLRERLNVWAVKDPSTLDGATYDYIVVGTGPAGCVVAGTLAREGFRTLVLERGGADHLAYVADPVVAPSAFAELRSSPLVRLVNTTAQAGLGGRALELTEPYVAGGGGSVGWSVYMRSCDALYDTWAALGNANWAWQDMDVFWKIAGGATDLTPAFVSDVSQSIMGGATMAGVKVYRSPSQWLSMMIEGFGTLMTTAHVDERSSPLELLRWTLQHNSPFLDLALHSTAKRVLFDDDEATGVEFEVKGELMRAYASAEVILSAGTIGSPSILMRSGVGPERLLAKLGVPVVKSLLGVGSNLQDHVMVPVAHNLKQGGSSIHSMDSYQDRLAYSLFGEGLVSSNLLEVGGLLKSSPDREVLDLELLGGPLWFVDHAYAPPTTETSTLDGATLLASLAQPRSTGHLLWESAEAEPLIDPAYLTEEADVDALLVGLKLARQIMSNAEDSLVGDEELPGMLVQSDDELKVYIREHALAGHDLSGTCKMGPARDKTAVVDSKLRVHGLRRLRVADLSICPTSPNGQGLATATMIGAKLADMIVEQDESPAA